MGCQNLGGGWGWGGRGAVGVGEKKLLRQLNVILKIWAFDGILPIKLVQINTGYPKTKIQERSKLILHTQTHTHMCMHIHTHTCAETCTHAKYVSFTDQNFVVGHIRLFLHSLYGPSVHSLACCQHTRVKWHPIIKQIFYENVMQKTCTTIMTMTANRSDIATKIFMCKKLRHMCSIYRTHSIKTAN